LKLIVCMFHLLSVIRGSIHPQGWVPIETRYLRGTGQAAQTVAFTPKGGCPLKLAPVGTTLGLTSNE